MLDAYLLLKNDSDQPVEGESTDKGFERTIEIRDFSLGERATGTGPSILPTATDDGGEGPTAVAGQIEEAVTDVRSQFVAELQKAAAANLKRQEIRKKTGSSFETSLMKAKDLVTEELLKRTPDPGVDPGGDRLTFKVTKDVDAASADLFQAYCATARQPNPDPTYRKMGEFKTAEVTIRKMFAGVPKPFLICTFSDVSITAYDLTFDSGRIHVTETLTFKFVRYKVRYQSQDATGQAGALTPETSGSVGAKDKA